MELDLYPKEHPEMTELISGCLGEYSTFHDTFKYYADGVSPTTATLPSGWQERLTRFSNDNMNGAVAHCLDPLDLAYAKLAAGRPKDLDYIEELARHHFIKPSAFTRLIEQTEDENLKQTLAERWQVIQGKRLAGEKSSVRSSDHGIGGI